MTCRDEPRDHEYYPKIKIYSLSSLLVDVTTDYARRLLLDCGMNERQIDIVNRVVRPEIELYREYSYGIVADELFKLQSNIIKSLHHANENPLFVFRTLQRLSYGRQKFLYTQRNMIFDIAIYIRDSGNKVDIFREFDHLIKKYTIYAMDIFEDRYADLKMDWKSGHRTEWDNKVNEYIFSNLEIEPGISSAFNYFNMRELIDTVMTRFDSEKRQALHDYVLTLTAQMQSDGWARHTVSEVLSFDEMAEQMAAEWEELRSDLEAQLNAM